MNDLLERYLSAVCSYFMGAKKKKVYKDLKQDISNLATHYDELEKALIKYGHPRSVALSYGYRPIFSHVYNPHYVSVAQRIMISLSFLYLFLSTIYYLQQLNCLPFQDMSQTASTFHTSTTITWILSHPIVIMLSILSFCFLFLILIDFKYPINQDYDVYWDEKALSCLPHPSHYPRRTNEHFVVLIFIVFFFIYGTFFSSYTIIEIQHSSSQMIHLMTYFFKPYIMIILFDYVIDITKKIYTRRYIKYSSFVNLFIVISLTFFVVNSHFLRDYLLPFNININYAFADILIVGALLLIYSISFYKLIRNLNSYKSLFKK